MAQLQEGVAVQGVAVRDKPSFDRGVAPVGFPFLLHIDSIGERSAGLK